MVSRRMVCMGCMAMYVGLCMAMYGYVGLCRAMKGYLGLCMAV